MNVDRLPGLTPEQIARMQQAGIRTCQQLLRNHRGERRLEDLASMTGLDVAVLRSIVQRAEMTEVRGIGPVAMANLLRTGISSLGDLAAQEPVTLQARLRQTEVSPPNLAVIEHWIVQARRRATHSSIDTGP